MSKSVMIIDTPRDCCECPFGTMDFGKSICLLDEGNFGKMMCLKWLQSGRKKMSEWITDRKPTKFGVYLVTLPDENSSGNSRFVDIETFDPEDGWDSLYKVLAWQELPKPYDGEIKEKCIPVSWISKWLEKQMDLTKNSTSQYNVKEFVRMILDWEKENETTGKN